VGEIAIRTGGQAGDGIASIGESLARCFSRRGLHTIGFNAYQSVIRGGHVWFQARASDHRIYTQGDGADILYALDKNTVDVHAHALRRGGTIIYDPEKFTVPESELPAGVKGLPVPTLEIARKFTSQSILQNAAGIGAAAFLAGVPLDLLHQVLSDSFGKKKGEVVDWNLGASTEGYHYAEQHASVNEHALPKRGEPLLLMTGNQAIALGAAAGGCKLLAQYPMTPATSIMHWMAAHATALGVVVKQAEDELAAVNMAIGASYAGVRAMTASSGGGFSLMVEALGMAGMTETPVVVVDAMRAGPSTGLPTKTEQADLNVMLGAGQGEFPRAILAMPSPREAYHTMIEAFRAAEAWQTPVMVATDFHLSETFATVAKDEIPLAVKLPSLFTVSPNDPDYLRYKYTESGVSPRSFPGQPGLQYVAGSDEHDEEGHLVSDIRAGMPVAIEVRRKMMDKRMRKIPGMAKDLPPPILEGPAGAPLTFVAWGSTVGAVRDAQAQLTAQGKTTNLIWFPTVYPINGEAAHTLLDKAHRTLLVEANFSGQLGRLLRAETGIHLPERLLKYDGEPFYPHEIVARALEVMQHGG